MLYMKIKLLIIYKLLQEHIKLNNNNKKEFLY